MKELLEKELQENSAQLIDMTFDIEGQHYHQSKEQPIEYIYKQGWGEGFSRGNACKYITRAGLKGSKEDAVKDLLKAIQYVCYILDYEYGEKYKVVKED